jgi:hypothetical protein
MESTAHFLSRIDWQQPWLAPLLPIAQPILEAQDWRQAINTAAVEKALRNHRNLPIRFVLQEELPPGTAYEAYISETGCVPTRDNLHDFFNALVWLTYTQIKVGLNAVQATEIASTSQADLKPAQRGKVRDAATIFDENAALLITNNKALVEDLRDHHWRDVFIRQRSQFQHACEVRLFGHALMEKLIAPYKAITAHAWVVWVDASFFAMSSDQKKERLDSIVAQELKQGVKTADFTPLPVLGIPGWWSGQDEAFYADASVFRPRRPIVADVAATFTKKYVEKS